MSDEDKNLQNPPQGEGENIEEKEGGDEENFDETPFFDFDDDEESGGDKDADSADKGGDKPEEKKTEGAPEGEFVRKSEYDSFKREQKVNEFMSKPENSDFKEFEGKIRELAAQPGAKGLTVDAIARMAVPKDYWIKKGAEMGSQADTESKQTYTSGAAARDEGGKGKSSELGDPYDIKDPAEFLATAMNMARRD